MKNFYKLILSVEDIWELSSTVEIEKWMLQSVIKEIIESYCFEYKCSEDDIKIKSIFEISLNNKVSLDYLKEARLSYKWGAEDEIFKIDSLEFFYKNKVIEVRGFSWWNTIDETLCIILDIKKWLFIFMLIKSINNVIWNTNVKSFLIAKKHVDIPKFYFQLNLLKLWVVLYQLISRLLEFAYNTLLNNSLF